MANKSVSVQIKADVAQFQSAMKSAAAATKQVEASAKTTGTATQAAGTAAAAGSQKMSTAATTAATAQQKAGQSAQTAATQTQKAGAAAGAAAAGTEKLTGATSKAAAGADKLGASSATAATGTGKIGTNAAAAATGADQLGTATGKAASSADKLGTSSTSAASSTQQIGTSASSAASGADQLGTATGKAATAATTLGTASGAAAANTGKIGTSASGAAKGTTELGAASGTAATGTSKLGAAAATIGGALDSAKSSISGAASQVTSSIPSYEQLAAKARENEQAWSTASTALLGFGAVAVAGVGMAVKTFADYDKAMSSVRAATHASEADMQALGDAAVTAGADTAFSAEEAARGIEELAKAGISTSDILGGGLDGALSLAAAGNLEVGDAAEIAASALTQFKLEGSDVTHIADLLAAGAGKAQGSVHDLGMALNQSGLVASQTGLTIEETTGGLAAFASAGLVGSDAGTSFKTMLQRLTPQSEEAAKMMDSLGLSAYDSQGEFIGLSEYAGQLQTALGGMSAEQRNATMNTLFGSDAVRAASVLYEQGSAGVEKWEAAVNDAGYAAETAALMQDNLAGDLEKLGGALDTVFLKAGSGANDALRSLVQGAESLVDAIGRVPGPVLTTVAGFTALAGGAALVAGGGMKVIAMAAETKDAFNTLGISTDGLGGKLAKVGLVAGGAMLALGAIGTIGKQMEPAAIGLEEISQALDTTGDSVDRVNAKFANAEWVQDGNWLSGGVAGIDSVSDAVERLGSTNGWDRANIGIARFLNYETSLGQMEQDIRALDESLAAMVSSGNFEGAGENFERMSEGAREAGMSASELIGMFPELSGAVQDYAASLDVSLSDQELLSAMMGDLPPKLTEAAGGADVAAEGISGMGEAAGEAAESLDDIVDSLFALGLTTQDARGAMSGYQESLASMAELAGEGGASLNAMGDDFDLTTESGRAMSDMFNDVAGSGIEAAQAQIELGNGARGASESLMGTYESLVSTATQLGMSQESAQALANDLLGIPDGVSVQTEMDSRAREMAGETKTAVDSIPGGKSVAITVMDQGSAGAVQEKINGIGGTQVTARVTDSGTVTLTQGQINEIYGKTTKVTVTDDGTIYHTQGGINGIADGDALVYVGDDGTIYKVQENINGVQDGAATVEVSASGVEGVKESIRGIKGSKVYVDVIKRTFGENSGMTKPSLHTGGRAPSMAGIPAAATGLRLPKTGPGTQVVDGIMGIASNGMPRVRVDAGEWIINRNSSDEYNKLLGLVNSDDPSVHHLKGLASGGRYAGTTGQLHANRGESNDVWGRRWASFFTKMEALFGPAREKHGFEDGSGFIEFLDGATAKIADGFFTVEDSTKNTSSVMETAAVRFNAAGGAADSTASRFNTAGGAADATAARFTTAGGAAGNTAGRFTVAAQSADGTSSAFRVTSAAAGKTAGTFTYVGNSATSTAGAFNQAGAITKQAAATILSATKLIANSAAAKAKTPAQRAAIPGGGLIAKAGEQNWQWKGRQNAFVASVAKQYGPVAKQQIHEDGSGKILLRSGRKIELDNGRWKFVSKFKYPRFADGGRLPATGLGTDQIVGVSSTTGLPTAMVDDREWVINQRSSDRYDGLLGMVNRDDPRVRHLAGFATGGRAESAPSPMAAYQVAASAPAAPVQIDYDRLAQAMTRVQLTAPVHIGPRDSAQIVGQGQRAMARGR